MTEYMIRTLNYNSSPSYLIQAPSCYFLTRNLIRNLNPNSVICYLIRTFNYKFIIGYFLWTLNYDFITGYWIQILKLYVPKKSLKRLRKSVFFCLSFCKSLHPGDPADKNTWAPSQVRGLSGQEQKQISKNEMSNRAFIFQWNNTPPPHTHTNIHTQLYSNTTSNPLKWFQIGFRITVCSFDPRK